MSLIKSLHVVGNNNKLSYQFPDQSIYQGSWKIAFSTAIFKTLKTGKEIPVVVSINWVTSLEQTGEGKYGTTESPLSQFIIITTQENQITLQQNLNVIFFKITNPNVTLKVTLKNALTNEIIKADTFKVSLLFYLKRVE